MSTNQPDPVVVQVGDPAPPQTGTWDAPQVVFTQFRVRPRSLDDIYAILQEILQQLQIMNGFAQQLTITKGEDL